MSEDTRGRNDADHCFVCGTDNPLGLHIRFRLDGGLCVGEFTPGKWHAGFDGVTHGGILFSVLDDVMANWLFLQGARGFTAKCEIRYRQPLPVGTPIRAECVLKQRKSRLVVLESKLTRQDDGSLVASAEASFMVDDFGRIPA
ncbi:MAG: PaaI family thioesterase [Gammaproteobacteria bacterium]|nr:PaaI family thioesterase [Gammaproteobacteria bacterium]MBI5616961.1 PaaI family thioesterase [Gammaproteobacteria bacterium]